ncbi:MAG: hypothetical protein IJN17_09205 [Clostridia bacterium]|nr:hypothetical protein [Clostridia bacterium]
MITFDIFGDGKTIMLKSDIKKEILKFFTLILLLSVLVFCLAACNDSYSSDFSEKNSTAETSVATEPAETDLNKEIDDNYINTVVSAEAALKLAEDKSGGITYYEAVKLLGSTGKNTSDLMYRYEWQLDDGSFLHVRFILKKQSDGLNAILKQSGGKAPANAVGSFEIDGFTYDPERIKSDYPDYSTYLYESYYKSKYESYSDFLLWFGYKDIPETEEVKVTLPRPEALDYVALQTQYPTIRTTMEKALNIKEGMTYYEAIVRLGAYGGFNSSMTGVYWKIPAEYTSGNEDIYFKAFLGGEGSFIDQPLLELEFTTPEDLGFFIMREEDIVWPTEPRQRK